MSHVLSPGEVDALLKGIGENQVSLQPGVTTARTSFSMRENFFIPEATSQLFTPAAMVVTSMPPVSRSTGTRA